MTTATQTQTQTQTPAVDWTYITAGNAVFTVEFPSTGEHFTFKARASADGRVTFLSLLTGRDNENDYSYLGLLDAKTGAVRLTAKSRVGEGARSVKAVRWALGWLAKGVALTAAHVHHEGACGRCGRTLTTPESVTLGFGPECRKVLGLE